MSVLSEEVELGLGEALFLEHLSDWGLEVLEVHVMPFLRRPRREKQFKARQLVQRIPMWALPALRLEHCDRVLPRTRR